MGQMERRNNEARFYRFLVKKLDRLERQFAILTIWCQREGWQGAEIDYPWAFQEELERRLQVLQNGEQPDWWV